MDLIKLQDKLQKEAKEIIHKFRILEILAKYGEAHIVGSVATGLMIREDIDVSCFVKKLDIEEFMSCVSDFMKSRKVRRMTLINEWQFKGERPQGVKIKELEEQAGLYFSIDKIKHKGRLWPYISIWMLSQSNKKSLEHVEWIKEKLDDKKKAIILRLKHHYCKLGVLSNVTSFRIYKAVLENDVENRGEFERYLRENEGMDVRNLL